MFDRETVKTMRERGRGRRAFWILVAVAGILVLWKSVGPSFGHTEGARGGRGFHDAADPAASIVNALDHLDAGEQKARAQEVVAGVLPALEELRAAGASLEERFAAALAAPELRAEEIRAVRDDGAALAAEALDVATDLTVRLAEVLTPEQRAELVAHWQARR